jgi:hypothetical protein
VRLSYSYHGAQEQEAPQLASEQRGRGEAPPPQSAPDLQTLKPAPYNLPWDGQQFGVPDGRDLWDELWAPAGQVRSEAHAHKPPPQAPAPDLQTLKPAPYKDLSQSGENSAIEGPVSRDKRPPRAIYRLHAKEQAVKGIKALRQHGWEVIVVGVGDETYAQQVHDKLWELGLVNGPPSPLMGENIVFVEHSSQVKDLAQQLGAVMGVVDHDWSTMLSMQGHVDPGCRCVLLQPTSADRDRYKQVLLERERVEASMSDKMAQLSDTIASLRVVEAGLLNLGVDMKQVLAQPSTASKEPVVHNLVTQLKQKESHIVHLTKEVEEAAALTSVRFVCCPRSRTEMAMAGSRSADAWTQACEVFGLDSDVFALQDGKCVNWAKPDGMQRAPFYPLAPGWHLGRTHWDELCDRGKPPPSASAGAGINVVCTDSGAFAIHSIEYGSPAYCSQMLRVGDLVISIDGIVLKGLMSIEVNRLLNGPANSPVTVAASNPAAPHELFYVYMTRKAIPTANKLGKGRLICLVDKIFLEEEVAPKTQLSTLRVRLRSARNLVTHSGSVFGIVKLSTFSPIHEEQRHSTASMQVSSSSAIQFQDEAFDMDLHDSVRQRIEVIIFQQDPSKREMSQALGRAVLSAQDVVTATSQKRNQWWRLLSSDLEVIVNPGGVPSEVQITAEILSHAQAKSTPHGAQTGVTSVAVQHQARQSKDEARRAEDVGVTLTIDDDYDKKVGNTEGGRKKYVRELSLDLAAALYTSEDRFIVCRLSRGSIVAFLNIVPDKAGVDLRSPKSLALLLKDQSFDRNSLLRFASTTKGICNVEICPPFNEPARAARQRERDGQEEKEREREGEMIKNGATDRPSRQQSGREQQPPLASDTKRGDIGIVSISGRRAPAETPKETPNELPKETPKQTPKQTPKDRAGELLSGLAEGQLRAKNPALHKMPAVVSLTFDDAQPASFGEATVKTIRLEAAKSLYLPPSMVEVGEVDSATRMVDVCIYPDNHLSNTADRSAEAVKHRELALQPGVQHVLASQLAAQVFEYNKTVEHNNPMRDTEVLKHVVWAQCIKEPANARTCQVVAGMVSGPTGLVSGSSGMVSGSTPISPGWEELRDDKNMRYWINHKDSVVSKSNPMELLPLPPSWEQRVDEHRRLQYRFSSQENCQAWQFEHPCASAVVYGVLVLGKGACMVALRQLASEIGWVRLEEVFFQRNPWATGQLEFSFDNSDFYTTVFDRSQTRDGLPGDVVAVYNLSCQYPNVPAASFPELEAPVQGEEFPALIGSMVDVMLKQYPERSYLVWRSTTSAKPPEGKDFVPIFISQKRSNGDLLHQLCHVVGPSASGSEGWVIADPSGQPWNHTIEELSEKGFVFESVGEIVAERPEEYGARVDPAAELPSSRRGQRLASDLHTTGAAGPFRAVVRQSKPLRNKRPPRPQQASSKAISSSFPPPAQGKVRQILSFDIKRGAPGPDGECSLIVAFPARLRGRWQVPLGCRQWCSWWGR